MNQGIPESPRLRAVEAFPVRQNGREGICLRDPFRYSDAMLFVSMGLVPLLQMMDGTRNLRGIQAEVDHRSGIEISFEELQGLVNLLDQTWYLDSRRFAARKEEVEKGFLDSSVRSACLAGQSYPESPEKLDEVIEGFFVHPEGPGMPEPGAGNPTPAGAIIPHIDFGRGGPVYAHAYRALVESTPADTYVVLGTSHMGAQGYFALTRKDFDTPYGPVRTDQEFVDDLVEEVGDVLFSDELSHRAEHSIEFQAVWLRRLLGRDRTVSIVPILCGSLDRFIENGGSPLNDPRFGRFVEGLKKAIAGGGKAVCLIASVDLAHVGPQFGDPDPVDDARLAEIQRRDREMLERVRRNDPEGFFRYVQEERDRRNVCGLSPIYTLLHTLAGRPGGLPLQTELLKYGVAPSPQGTVTFASLVLR